MVRVIIIMTMVFVSLVMILPPAHAEETTKFITPHED